MFLLNLLIESLFNLLSITGIFIIFGFIFNLIEIKNNRLLYLSFGEKGLLITGVVGTVVHELSHLVMALIFNHKIIKVELFRPFKYKEDSVLGYVNHTYSTKSIYQQIGNFFIGIAPMIFGTLIIWILLFIFSDSKVNELISSSDINIYLQYFQEFNILKIFQSLVFNTVMILKSILSFNFKSIILIFLIYSISSHMTLSTLDLKGSFKGLIFIFFIIFLLTLLSNLLGFNNIFSSLIIFKLTIYTSIFLSLGLIFSLFTLFVSYIIYIFKKKSFNF